MANRTKSVAGLAVALTVCYGAAGVGGFFTAGSIQGWYATLAKPSWNPPAWVFGPVWTVLYGMMAVAVWLVWLQRHDRPITVPIAWFAVQLIFNAAWSPLFFGLHRIDLALVDIAGLWIALAVTARLFFKQRVIAGALLTPYLLWVSFATTLNLAIWRLNT
jgi:tryptophan-rich sensory protein